MYLKTKWLSKQRNGAGVVFATGTPISNTLNEIYTMLRYLHYDKLKELDIEKFDDFARCFTVEAKSMELTPGGDDLSKGYSQFFENIAPVKKLVDEIEKESGKKISSALNPYIAFRNFKGMAGRENYARFSA